MGLFDFITARSEAIAANRQTEKVDEFNLDTWKFNNREAIRDYNHTLKGNAIRRGNIEAEAAYTDATNQQNYRYQLAIADAQDRMNAAAYSKSLQTYGLQRSFNNQAAASAYARKLQEAVTEMSFQNQDITIQALQEAGTAQARGASGRSAGKELHAVLAQAGRNQAILAESLSSADANFRQANEKIRTDKYGADINAWGNLMVKPIAAARPEAPLATPRAVIQDPRRPRKPPKPVKGAKVDVGMATLGGIVSSVESAVSMATVFS